MPEFNLAHVVRGAAYGTGCPVGVFYLCSEQGFEVAATFGCSIADAAAEDGLPMLHAARRQPDGLTIFHDAHRKYDLRTERPWLFGATAKPARFVAAAHVTYAQKSACGLLLVADSAPRHGFSAAQSGMLRAGAARITEMLECQAKREAAKLGAQPEPMNDLRGRLLESIAQHVPDAIMVTQAAPTDPTSQRIVFCNAAFGHLTGYSEAELIGLSPGILQSDRADRGAVLKLHAALLHRETVAVELLQRKKNGDEFVADVRVVPVPDPQGEFWRWFELPRQAKISTGGEDDHRSTALAEAEIARLENEKAALEAEIHERKRIEARLHYLAFHDNLTSAYNRQFLIDRLAEALDRLTTDPEFRFAVLLLDLDRFKLINDSFGHRAGDMMLIEIAKRLRNCIRAEDIVGRLGGDEFAILIQGFDDPDYVASVARRVMEVVRYPVQMSGQEILSSASIGGAYATKYYRVPEDVLRDADIAMYEAKRLGKGFLVFDDSMHRQEVVSSQLRTELQRAVTRSEFYVEYQPIFDLRTREITGMEALIRWQHPTRGPLLPGAFIGVAEEMGLTRQIGGNVLRAACKQMREWQDHYPGFELRLSVNISGHELTDIRFIPQLNEILLETGLSPDALQLEVTESVLFPSTELMVTVLKDAKALGVRIALDDFGTGYSSLGYLDHYPIDAIKIDLTFVAGLSERYRPESIVKAIIDLAGALELEVTGEGIEDAAQVQALVAMGCTQGQGFLLSKPLAADAIEKLLRKGARR